MRILTLILTCLFLLSCATEQHQPQPINSSQTTAKILAKDPTSIDFKNHLLKQGYQTADLPFTDWGVDELTLCALFYHTKLEVAKARLGLANTAIKTAGHKKNLALSGSIAHSNQANDDIRPWAYGLNVEIPIETSNKRAIKAEQAQKLANAARMDVADAAWQLRSQIARDLTHYHQNIATTALLSKELAMQTDIADMQQKRVDIGLESKTALSNALLHVLKTQSALSNEQAKLPVIKAKLAADVGLSTTKFDLIKIKPLDLESALVQQGKLLEIPFQSKTLQEKALLNRIDIRRSLEKYAAAEAKIKLSVAKLTPDISLSPGFAFEFGDKIWSLGFFTLLNLLNQNTTLVEEARQLRAIEGAEFENLQAQIIADLSQAYAQYQATKQTATQATQQHAQQLRYSHKIQKQFDAGLISQLAVKKHALNNLVTEQQVLTSRFKLLQVANQIEDVMQTPIYTHFEMPTPVDQTDK